MPTDAEIEAAVIAVRAAYLKTYDWRVWARDALAAAEVVRETQPAATVQWSQPGDPTSFEPIASEVLNAAYAETDKRMREAIGRDWWPADCQCDQCRQHRAIDKHDATNGPQPTDTQPPRKDYHTSAVPGDGIETAGPMTHDRYGYDPGGW